MELTISSPKLQNVNSLECISADNERIYVLGVWFKKRNGYAGTNLRFNLLLYKND